MLPNAHLATIDASKLRDYLLSPSHPIGRFKAVVFARLGYTAQNWEKLHADLLALARSGVCIAGPSSAYGQKYLVSGILMGPSGRAVAFQTIWILSNDQGFPKFVTAYTG